MKLACILIMFIGMSAHAYDGELIEHIDDLKNEIGHELRMQQLDFAIANLPPGASLRQLPDNRPEWERTGCKTHIDVIDGAAYSICDRDANGNIVPGAGQ